MDLLVIVICFLTQSVVAQPLLDAQYPDVTAYEEQTKLLHGIMNKLEVIEMRLDRLETNANEPTLLGLWPLSESQGGTDITQYSNNMTLHDVLFDDSCDVLRCQKVVHFKGTPSSYGEIPGGGVLDVQKSFTWMAWFYPETTKQGVLFEWHGTGLRSYWGLHLLFRNGRLWFNSNCCTSGVESGSALVIGQWNRVAIAYEFSSGVVGMNVNGNVSWKQNVIQHIHYTHGDVRISSRKSITGDTHYNGLHGMMACVKLYQGVTDLRIVEEDDPQCPYITN